MLRQGGIDAVRYACGQINKTATEAAKDDHGPPSPRVDRARSLFSAPCFKGGRFGNHAGDAIGQLWLLGKLDMTDMDETRLLDAARIWWHGRAQYFGEVGFKVAKFERASRTSNRSTKLSKPEREFQKYAALLLDAEEYDRDCLEDLMETTLDGEFASWVTRIIQTELLKFIRLPIVLLATTDDYLKLAAALRALRAMAGAEAVREQKAA
jgi:hypothetical protein